MAEPKFRPGLIVQLRRDVRGFEGGPYEILRLLLDEGGEQQYRVREATQRERVFAEHELIRAPSDAPRPPLAGRRPTR